MTESWMPVIGFEGYYEVSDLGRVRSLERFIEHPTSGRSLIKGKLLRLTPNSDGYVVVTLINSAERKRRVAKVQFLVLEAFVGPRPLGMECCHANDERRDNRLVNLRWDTRSGNVRDQVLNGRHNMLSSNRARRAV